MVKDNDVIRHTDCCLNAVNRRFYNNELFFD